MPSRSAVLSALLVSLSAVAAAPAPAPRPRPVYYFPTTVGTRWVYQEGDREHVEAITEVTEKGGEKLVTVSSEWKGKLTPRYIFSVSEKGIGVVAADAADLDEPCWVLSLPHQHGKRWDVVLAVTGVGKWTGKAAAFGPERVEVPAGTHTAIRVETDIHFLGERRRFSQWYAPGVGVVKVTGGGEKDRVLKSFTRG